MAGKATARTTAVRDVWRDELDFCLLSARATDFDWIYYMREIMLRQ